MLATVETERLYRNIKTQKCYCVIALARHSETNELLVVYRALDRPNFETWARPVELFKEKFELAE